MYFKTTQAHEALRAEIREWAEREIKPIAFTLDKENRFPKEQIMDFGKRGYLGLPYPEEYGGMGKDILSYAIGVEELSRVDGGTGVIYWLMYRSERILFLHMVQKNRSRSILCRWQRVKKSVLSDLQNQCRLGCRRNRNNGRACR